MTTGSAGEDGLVAKAQNGVLCNHTGAHTPSPRCHSVIARVRAARP
jgi:hypothetical protein